jgi:selenide, water dikinase
LEEILKDFPLENDPDLLVGTEHWADAAIYRLSDEIAIVQTLDFFTPIVNDPFSYGRIAAANSFSDIYAMGGKPITAMNIVCFPVKDTDKAILREILRGGLETIHRAGAVMAGGHSVEDPEMKYGLSVTGLVHPDCFITNKNAKAGDVLVLTKPVGTGILTTALKGGVLNDKQTAEITELMATLNRGASEAMMEVGVNAATDITGFGLLGHALEMAKAGNVGIRLHALDVPIIPDTMTFAAMGMVPEGSHRNRNFCLKDVQVSPRIDPLIIDVLTDAQTSGGLLISVPGEKADLLLQKLIGKNTPSAKIVGEVVSESEIIIQVV